MADRKIAKPEPVTFRLQSSAAVGQAFAGVHIDEAGNFIAESKGDPRGLAVMLRAIADHIDEEVASD